MQLLVVYNMGPSLQKYVLAICTSSTCGLSCMSMNLTQKRLQMMQYCFAMEIMIL